MALQEDSLNNTTTVEEICSQYGLVKICSTLNYNHEGGYKLTTMLTFNETYSVNLDNTITEVHKLSDGNREIIRVLEVRYDAYPDSSGVRQIEDEITISDQEMDYAEVVTVSLQTEPTDYLRPKVPKAIIPVN